MTDRCPGAWRRRSDEEVDRVLHYSLSDDDSPCPRVLRCGSTGLDTMMSLRYEGQQKHQQKASTKYQQHAVGVAGCVSPISPPRAELSRKQEHRQQPQAQQKQPGRWRSESFSPVVNGRGDAVERYTLPDRYSVSPQRPGLELTDMAGGVEGSNTIDEDDVFVTYDPPGGNEKDDEEFVLPVKLPGGWREHSKSTSPAPIPVPAPAPEPLSATADLAAENSQLLEWNRELQSELEVLSRELQARHRDADKVAKLEKKLQEKGQVCEALRTRLRDLAERVEREGFRETSPSHVTAGEVARLQLLEEERLQQIEEMKQQLAEKDSQLEEQKRQTEERVERLQETVRTLAAGVKEVQMRHQEVNQKQQEIDALRGELRDKDFELEDERVRREHSEEEFIAQVKALDRELDTTRDDAQDWRRKYRELRSSLPSQGADDADEQYAQQQHRIYNDLADTISNTIFLQKLVVNFSTTSPFDQETANTEPKAERRHRLDQLSVAEACQLNYEHLCSLKSAILDAITQQDTYGGRGCDVQ